MDIRTELKVNQIFQELWIDKYSQGCIKSFYEDILSDKEKEKEDAIKDSELNQERFDNMANEISDLERKCETYEDKIDDMERNIEVLEYKITEYEKSI